MMGQANVHEQDRARGEAPRIACDLCIVGAEPAARILAMGMARRSCRVVILDPGRGEDGGEVRSFIPLTPTDIDPGRGATRAVWPLGHDELEPYFVHVRDRFDLPMGIHDERVFEELGVERPAFDRQRVRAAFGQFPSGRPTAIGAVLAFPAPSPSVLHLDVDERLKIVLSAAGTEVLRIDALERGGGAIAVEARAFVLAGDALANARWLLASREVQPRGVGNDLGNVGRFTTTRRAFVLGEVRGRGRAELRRWHRRRASRHGFVVEPWIAMRHEEKSAEHALDVGLRFESLPRSGKQRHGEIAADSFLTRPGLALGLRRLFVTGAVVEGPDTERSIDSLREVSAQPPVDSTRTSLLHVLDTLSRELERLTLGTCTPLAWLRDGASDAKTALDFERPLAGDNLAGTTRMSLEPSTGVVDRDGRVHGVANLYCAGVSVLPSLGWSDPIHPVAALCLRLEDHLRRELGA